MDLKTATSQNVWLFSFMHATKHGISNFINDLLLKIVPRKEIELFNTKKY